MFEIAGCFFDIAIRAYASCSTKLSVEQIYMLGTFANI